MRKELGKIEKAEIGFGGYNESMLGLKVELKFGECCFVQDFIHGGYKESIQVTEYSKWSEEDRGQNRIDFIKKLDKILSDAKVENVSDLKNKPVEITLDGLVLKDWRILTEVL